MATSLNGLQISATYEALIKVGDNNPVTGVLKVLSDGDGNDLPVRISLSEVELTAGKTMTILGTLDTTSGVINVATPTQAAHATTKAYVDAQIVALDITQIETDIANNLAAIQVNANDIADNLGLIGDNATAIDALEAGTGNVIGVRSNANPYIAGNVTLQQGSNVTLSQVGSTITIASSGGGGGGSNDFGIIASTGEPDIVAQIGNDTLNVEKSGGITIANDNATTTMTLGTDSAVLTYRTLFDPVATQVGTNQTDIAALQAATHVNSFNTLTGDVTISGGTGITLSPTGNDIEIASTVSEVTINNNTNNNILTASGTANTIEGEPLFTYDSTTGTVSLYAGATNGLQLDAGTVPSANPTIGSTGFFTQLEFSSNVITSNDIIIRDQGKIAFDTDPTNTYIAANASTPEDLEIHADQDLHLLPDGNVGIGTTTPTNKLHVVGNTFTSADFIGDGLVVGSINYNKQISIQTPSTTFPAQGELSPIAGTGLTAGQLYYLNSSGVWTIADATTEASCKNMLGIAISATEVMIRGHLSYTAYAGFSDGEPLYVKPSATGDITNLVPSTSGHIVRKIGFCLDGSVRSIYFNPSNDYFEVE